MTAQCTIPASQLKPIYIDITLIVGDYADQCRGRHWDGCAPNWPRYIEQLQMACLEIGIPVNGTCRVYIGTEGGLKQLPQYGCASTPRIEFVCESCENISRACLQVIPTIPFESRPEWTHSGNCILETGKLCYTANIYYFLYYLL